MNKKSNILYLDKQTHSYLDVALNPAKLSKNDILITQIKAKELLKHQLSIKKSEFTQMANITDYLYARCIQEGIFQAQKDYMLSYILEEKSSEFLCHIYAKIQATPAQKNRADKSTATKAPAQANNKSTTLAKNPRAIPDFFIPDIFLPMALEDSYRESSLFLFENSLVFYYQGNFTYHTFIADGGDIDRALHYIQTIYSKISLVVCDQKDDFVHLDTKICTLSEITNSPNPLALLCFEYFQKHQANPLPILCTPDNHFKKSKTFSMLSKIACAILLMLLLPIAKIGYGFYINHQIKTLQAQNNQILEAIEGFSKNSTAVFEQTKTQNQLQNHLHSLQEIESFYTPRYNIIAKISRLLAGKNIFVKNFYFTSDIAENVQVFELDVSSPSEQNLVKFMQDLSSTPLIAMDTTSPHKLPQNEKIFSNGIFRNGPNSSTKIIWISNAL